MALKRIVNLHASWCAPCKAFESIFKTVSEDDNFKDIAFERYDIESDEGTELTEKHSVKAVPTTLLLDENNSVIIKMAGSMTESDFKNLINRNIVDNKEL